MSEAGTTREARVETAVGGERASSIALWALQVGLALLFAMAGMVKVIGAPAAVEMFDAIGIGQWFRYLVGASEIAGAVGVLVPRFSGLAALGLVCLMAGATLTSAFVLGASPLFPAVLLLVATVVAWGRWPRTRALLGGLGR